MLITATDIAKELRISRKRVYELMTLRPEFGGIPNYKFGRTKRVQRSDFELWLKSKLQA